MKYILLLFFLLLLHNVKGQEERKYLELDINSPMDAPTGLPLGLNEYMSFYSKVGDTVRIDILKTECIFIHINDDSLMVNCLGDTLSIQGHFIVPNIKLSNLTTTISTDIQTLKLKYTICPYLYYKPVRNGKWKIEIGNTLIEKEYDPSLDFKFIELSGQGRHNSPIEPDVMSLEEIKN